jgi:hypothetical protein
MNKTTSNLFPTQPGAIQTMIDRFSAAEMKLEENRSIASVAQLQKEYRQSAEITDSMLSRKARMVQSAMNSRKQFNH